MGCRVRKVKQREKGGEAAETVFATIGEPRKGRDGAGAWEGQRWEGQKGRSPGCRGGEAEMQWGRWGGEGRVRVRVEGLRPSGFGSSSQSL